MPSTIRAILIKPSTGAKEVYLSVPSFLSDIAECLVGSAGRVPPPICAAPLHLECIEYPLDLYGASLHGYDCGFDPDLTAHNELASTITGYKIKGSVLFARELSLKADFGMAEWDGMLTAIAAKKAHEAEARFKAQRLAQKQAKQLPQKDGSSSTPSSPPLSSVRAGTLSRAATMPGGLAPSSLSPNSSRASSRSVSPNPSSSSASSSASNSRSSSPHGKSGSQIFKHVSGGATIIHTDPGDLMSFAGRAALQSAILQRQASAPGSARARSPSPRRIPSFDLGNLKHELSTKILITPSGDQSAPSSSRAPGSQNKSVPSTPGSRTPANQSPRKQAALSRPGSAVPQSHRSHSPPISHRS